MFSKLGRRKENKYLFTVYAVSKDRLVEARKLLKNKYKTIKIKQAGKPIGSHYAIWCRGVRR